MCTRLPRMTSKLAHRHRVATQWFLKMNTAAPAAHQIHPNPHWSVRSASATLKSRKCTCEANLEAYG